MILELDGFEVVAASSPTEAYKKLEELSAVPNLIITDYHMGHEESGTDLIQNVRTSTGVAVPAVLVTGDTSSTVDGSSMEDLEILSKPVDPERLLSVAHVLSRH